MSILSNKNISFKLGFILVISIVVPMIIFAFLSLSISSKADFEAVSRGNQKAALLTSEQIGQYITNSINILRSITENINGLHLGDSEKDIVLKNYVLQFQEFDEIVVTDRKGKEIVTSEMGGDLKDHSEDVVFKTTSQNKIYFSDVIISDNFVPFMTIAVPSFLLGEFDGAIIGKINLVNMWRLVDSLTIGKRGYSLVVSDTGLLIAHGEGNSKPGIIRKDNLSDLQIVREVLEGKSPVLEYKNQKGTMVLGTAAPVKIVNWGLIIEQPLSEAYASTYSMGKRLILLGLIILIVMSVIAYIGVNRSVIRPLKTLVKGMGGSFDSGDEFNSLSKSLGAMEETLEKYSKEAQLGNVSTNFAHDIKVPIDNITRMARSLARQVRDAEFGKSYRKMVDEQSDSIKQLIEKVKEPMAAYARADEKININVLLNDVRGSFDGKLKDQKIAVVKELDREDLFVTGNRLDLERVIKNIINNAIEAMEEGGRLTLSSRKESSLTIISVSDTGHGIEPGRMKTLFTKSGSSKKEGWGIGLSGSKELVEKMDGRIEVESEPGKGATFTLYFKSQ